MSDQGIGIEQENIHKIFDAFFTTKGDEEGTGLGLAMVYNIMKHFKGFIDLESSPGEGTSFYLYFPVSMENLESTITEQDSHSNFKSEGMVLVVDDDKVLRNTARLMLEEWGFDVILAKDGWKESNFKTIKIKFPGYCWIIKCLNWEDTIPFGN